MIVELPAEMVLARAREVRDQLLAALARGESLELDPSRVERIDAAGLQLLCGVHKSLGAKGLTLTMRGGRGAVIGEVAARAGLGRHRGCSAGCLWLEQSR